ncbi:MAG: hypothetical protein H0X49_06675 [Acidobacteria bacterium]|nr:hypothetical protein [Acidobacteriota bacterium]
MKAILVSKIFFLFICLCAFASAIHAQEEKPRVVEIARVGEKSDETEIHKLTKVLGEFISRLEKEPATTKGFINVPVNTKLGKKIKLFVADAEMESRVRYLSDSKNPNYNHTYVINLLLVPQGAEIPKIYTLGPCICPTLDIIAPEIVTNQKSILTFEAKAGDDDIDGLSYNWYVSAGKIIEGQGTPTIKVDAEGAKEITATVYIDGFCETCARRVSSTTEIKDN